MVHGGARILPSTVSPNGPNKTKGIDSCLLGSMGLVDVTYMNKRKNQSFHVGNHTIDGDGSYGLDL